MDALAQGAAVLCEAVSGDSAGKRLTTKLQHTPYAKASTYSQAPAMRPVLRPLPAAGHLHRNLSGFTPIHHRVALEQAMAHLSEFTTTLKLENLTLPLPLTIACTST